MMRTTNKERLQNNKEENFQKLFVEYYSPLVAFAHNYTADINTAKDIVQDMFVKIWDDFYRLSEVNNISAYLYQAVRFRCYNFLRDKRHFGNYEDGDVVGTEDASFEQYVIEEETFRILISETDKLPAKCKLIFNMSINGLKAAEIAEELNIAVETVKKQKKIARKVLRDKIKKAIYCFVSYIHT